MGRRKMEDMDNIVETPTMKSKEDTIVSCLRKEKVTVKFILRQSGNVTDPKHVLYGGMSESSVRYFTVPILSSTGSYKNVLTNSEKTFLEQYMGLEYNALSIYATHNNYWDNYTVRLTKQDTYLDLSDPNDYIKYKVLLANTDFIAPSLEAYQNMPKETYQFVLISEGEVDSRDSEMMSNTMQAYKEFGKIEDNKDIMRLVIETLDGRPMASSTKIEALKVKINTLIQADAAMFLKVVKDPYLETKVLIKKAVENGLISRRGDYYYNKEDNSPLCLDNEEPVLNVVAKYLNLPKNQEYKFSIEAKLK